MASCLGLYIENNLIKYAKVSKSNDVVKVESFGIKFYDDMEDTLKQIVEETYSFKEPICVNSADELYSNFEIFKLLKKKDFEGVVDTEFESLCYEKELNKNTFETKFIITESSNNADKIKVINIAIPKITLEQRKKQLVKYRIKDISPISTVIPKLIKTEKKENVIIVNIEKNTIITKVSGSNIKDIITLPIGAKNILDNIKNKENSYSKAYQICKETTIYTDTDKDLQYEENEYLEDIMPTLFNIITEVRRIIDESLENINKVYITGIAATINNVDLYFQEYLKNVTCEILKPSFISNNSKINIKDYIEVNSAIALACQGLEKNNQFNFASDSLTQKVIKTLTSDISVSSKKKSNNKNIRDFTKKFEKIYNLMSFFAIFGFISYLSISLLISKELDKKNQLAEAARLSTNEKIEEVKNYNTVFNRKITEYEKLIANIQNINAANSEDKRYKNTIPNLLNNIMAVIPKTVQLTSIENNSSTHIVIIAKTSRYEQIAFFKTKLKIDGILENVVSDTGTMQGDGTLSVVIEGELP